jgi:flagellar basal-body rod protein FlgF
MRLSAVKPPGIKFAGYDGMYKGIYLALSGAVLKYAQMEIISQNLANADTVAYKRGDVAFKDYLIPQDEVNFDPDGRAMSYFSSFNTDLSAGTLIRTGNNLDIGIEGSGFLSLEGNRYTRRGDLKRDSKGYLCIHNGMRVMGEKGPIKLPDGVLEISESGDILVNGAKVNSLKIVNFHQTENPDKAGGDIFFSKSKVSPSKAIVKQGYLEKSNVDVVKEMVRMIEMLREFESYQKAIQYFDEAQGKATNEIARL